jgi:indole-3-glycerol phosphate synthase
MRYKQTGTILDRILDRKVQEIEEHQKYISLAELRTYLESIRSEEQVRDFADALRTGDNIALIAEIKKASPSKGVLIENFDPVELAKTYSSSGASALSVLTDQHFFQGDLKFIYDVRMAVDLPVLRKDFLIDSYQIYASRVSGADALLLIVAALDDKQLAELLALTYELGMVALVEVHNEAEVDSALKAGARLIGVNNRDLMTFEVDLNTTARLAGLLPDDATLVAESGVFTPEDVRNMGRLGAHAVLVGEALVIAPDIGAQVKLLSGEKRLKHDH